MIDFLDSLLIVAESIIYFNNILWIIKGKEKNHLILKNSQKTSQEGGFFRVDSGEGFTNSPPPSQRFLHNDIMKKAAEC